MWFWPWQLSLHTGVCLTSLLLPYTEMDSDPDFLTGPLCVKLSAFSFNDSKAINVNKWWRYFYVPRRSVSVHWAGYSSIGSLFPRKCGTGVAWLVGRKKSKTNQGSYECERTLYRDTTCSQLELVSLGESWQFLADHPPASGPCYPALWIRGNSSNWFVLPQYIHVMLTLN